MKHAHRASVIVFDGRSAERDGKSANKRQRLEAVAWPIMSTNLEKSSETKKSNALNDVMKGCMAEKGYILVKKSEALATSQRLKATAKK